MLFFFLMTASVSDYVSSSIIKPTVERLRPCNDDQISHLVIHRVTCGNGYSFPSSHATNHMGMAVFLLLLFKNVFAKGRYIFLLWAIIISFAQVYVGVHYPSDILGGWILGTIIAVVFYKVLQFYIKHYFSERTENVKS